MVSSTGTPLGTLRPVFTDEQLASLARTCGAAHAPVWVCDFHNRCVYQNTPAARVARVTGETAAVFEIMDHRGNVVGTLTTMVN